MKNKYMRKKENFIKEFFIGLVVGFTSGFFGAGGGLLLVPYFSKKFKDDERMSRATTVFCVLFMVITSSLFYIKESKVDLLLSFKCVLGGCIGSFIGAKVLEKINQNFLKVMFIVFLLYSSFKMIIGE